jgi:hypothetical protein
MNMKKQYKILLAILILITGCSKDFLDINEDPNYPTTAPLSQLLTNVEVQLGEALSIRYGLSNFAAVYMHEICMREDPDQYGINGTSFYTNNPWDEVYTDPLQDLELMIKTGDEGGDLIYAGIARILKAYTFGLLVDVYADVPFSEANKNTEGNPYPKYDSGSEIYPQLFALLDQGIANINDATATNIFEPGDDDLIYQGDKDKWVRAANTIKLKLYTNVRLVQDVSSAVNALITGDKLIEDGGDMMLPYGTSKTPDNRNPGFLEYEAGQKGFYISPWFYMTLKGYRSDIFSGIEDPRIPYYFYNQLAPGQDTREGNPTEYRDGGFVAIYFGSIGPNRDHSTDGSMTVMGIYPVGGRFDEGDHKAVDVSSGTGAAPYRLLTYADRLYIQAELVNAGLVSGVEKDLLESAMIASFKQVDHVIELTQTTQSVPVLDGSAEAATYIDAILAEYNDAADAEKRLEIIMTQKWIANFGNNVDQWTDYRRTNYPVVFDPRDATQAPGGFVSSPDGPTVGADPLPIPVQRINEIPMSLPWSQDDLLINPNSPSQKNPATFKVFWDN